MNIQRIVIEVSDDTKNKLRLVCAKKGKTQKEVVTELIEKWLKNKKG